MVPPPLVPRLLPWMKPAPSAEGGAQVAALDEASTLGRGVGDDQLGVLAADIAKNFYKKYVEAGYEKNYVYGPLHGTGLIEVEAPWCETSSEYNLQTNMTYQVDTFIATDTFGVRWEKGIAVKENGCEILSPEIPESCIELDF